MIINSLKQTVNIIKKNKAKILLVFFLQVIFFIALSVIFYQQIIPAMDHAKNAIEYYDTINITENPGRFDYLGEDPLTIYDNYQSMMYYLKFMALYSILSFIILNGLLWALNDNLVNKKNKKEFLNYFLNFTILTGSFIMLFYLLIFKTLKASLIKLEYTFLPLIGALFLFFILLYFLFIGFSIINKRKIKNILKLMFSTGIFKFPKIILIYLINILIISLFFYLIYLTVELNIILLSIIIILFVFSFVFTKLFLIVAIKNLIEKN